MCGGPAPVAPDAPEVWGAILGRGGGGLLVCQRAVSQNGGPGVEMAGGGGAQAGALRSPPGSPGADQGAKAHSNGGTRRTPSPDLGCALGALHRHVSWTGAGRPGAGAVDPAHAGGQRTEDRGKRAELDLGGGRPIGWV